MAGYSLFFKESVQKDLHGIPKKDLRRILTRIKSLAGDPRPQGCEKLTGQGRYRLRQGRYRIGYAIQDEERLVTVVKVTERTSIAKANMRLHEDRLLPRGLRGASLARNRFDRVHNVD